MKFAGKVGVCRFRLLVTRGFSGLESIRDEWTGFGFVFLACFFLFPSKSTGCKGLREIRSGGCKGSCLGVFKGF